MWWSRKLATRCLRLHRAKSTTSANSSLEPPQTLGIIGVPFAKGQGKQGVELAPDLLRQSSLRQVLQSSHGECVASVLFRKQEIRVSNLASIWRIIKDFTSKFPKLTE